LEKVKKHMHPIDTTNTKKGWKELQKKSTRKRKYNNQVKLWSIIITNFTLGVFGQWKVQPKTNMLAFLAIQGIFFL
jgi:hypothetical protein